MNLLISDYDNTFELHYDNMDLDTIFKNNKKAVDKLMEKDLFGIATGRHFDAMKKTIDDKNLKFNYLCCNNGAEIYDNNLNLLYCLPIDKIDLNTIKEKFKDGNIFYRTPFNYNKITSINFYFNDLTQYEKTYNYLEKNLKKSFIEHKYPKIKILNKGCDKVNFVDFLKERIKIDNEKIYTIGDDVNDINMIKKYSGYSLNTAQINVKKEAKYILKDLKELCEKINIKSEKNRIIFKN